MSKLATVVQSSPPASAAAPDAQPRKAYGLCVSGLCASRSAEEPEMSLAQQLDERFQELHAALDGHFRNQAQKLEKTAQEQQEMLQQCLQHVRSLKSKDTDGALLQDLPFSPRCSPRQRLGKTGDEAADGNVQADSAGQMQEYNVSEGSTSTVNGGPSSLRIVNQMLEATSEEVQGRRSSLGSTGGVLSISSHPQQFDGQLAACVRSSKADAIIGLVIIANAVFMGIQSDYQARNPGVAQPSEFLVLDVAFNVVFLTELCLRAVALRWSFFAASEVRWNVFDSIIVTSGAVEQVIGFFLKDGAVAADLTYLRVMRVLKLASVFRIVRVVIVFRELRIMLLSVFATMRSLLWTIISLFVLTFMTGVYIAATVAEHQADGFDGELAKYFGSLPKTLVALFQATSGGTDWRVLAEELDKASAMAVVVLYLYICIVLYAIMNILTGVCVNQATKAADDDVEFVIEEQLTRQNGASNILRKLFHDADESKSGELTWSQLQGHLRDPRVRAYFRTLGLDVWDLRRFFELLQTGGGRNRSIAIEHFVRGCLRLKGHAKSVDLLVLRHEVDGLARIIAHLQGSLRREVEGGVSAALEGAAKPAADQPQHHDVSVAF